MESGELLGTVLAAVIAQASDAVNTALEHLPLDELVERAPLTTTPKPLCLWRGAPRLSAPTTKMPATP